MANKSYWQKLKDPRWQKKRLETLNHYAFTCQMCSDTESPLHVHHKEYFKGNEPWEYAPEQLTVLCESCHESIHDSKDVLKFVCSYLEFDGPRDRYRIALIIGGFIGLPFEEIIEDSEMNDCKIHRAYYHMGEVLAHGPQEWRKFIPEGE